MGQIKWRKTSEDVQQATHGEQAATLVRVGVSRDRKWAVEVNGARREAQPSLKDAREAAERIMLAEERREHQRVAARVRGGAMRAFGPAELETLDKTLAAVGSLMPKGHERNRLLELSTMAGLERIARETHEELLAATVDGEDPGDDR